MEEELRALLEQAYEENERLRRYIEQLQDRLCQEAEHNRRRHEAT